MISVSPVLLAVLSGMLAFFIIMLVGIVIASMVSKRKDLAAVRKLVERGLSNDKKRRAEFTKMLQDIVSMPEAEATAFCEQLAEAEKKFLTAVIEIYMYRKSQELSRIYKELDYFMGPMLQVLSKFNARLHEMEQTAQTHLTQINTLTELNAQQAQQLFGLVQVAAEKLGSTPPLPGTDDALPVEASTEAPSETADETTVEAVDEVREENLADPVADSPTAEDPALTEPVAEAELDIAPDVGSASETLNEDVVASLEVASITATPDDGSKPL